MTKDIDTVCFIGAGTMGCFNALLAAVAGYDAKIYDISSQALEQVVNVHSSMIPLLLTSGLLSEKPNDQVMSRISLHHDLQQATANAQLVSESVSENLEVKREVHRQLDAICSADTILTSNTSALLISEIETAVSHGERIAALHSHLGSPLFDIVAGTRTSAATIAALKRYVLSIDAVPLVLQKENPGYVLNAMLGPVLTMAMILHIHELASLQDVDRAWMHHRAAPMGPFAMMDLFGLDVVLDSWRYRDIADPNLKNSIVSFLNGYTEKGKLGLKAAAGFYNYPEPAYEEKEFAAFAPSNSLAYDALHCVLIENAILIHEKAVASSEDIDLAWTVGTHLDQGPFELLKAEGGATFSKRYKPLQEMGLFSAENAAIVHSFLQA